jgi:hypothetical protein
LLIDLETTDLSGPLAQFNASLCHKEEIFKLITAINQQLGKDGLSDQKLGKAFNPRWSELEIILQQVATKATKRSGTFQYDVFFSTPMAGFLTDAEYQSGRANFKTVFDSLKQQCGLSVYWGAEKISSMKDFDTMDISAIDDLRALQQSRQFVLLYPQKLATSALFEAGYALALNRFSRYFVRDRDDLPFLMRELPGSSANVRIHTDDDWKDYNDLAAKMVKYKDKWFTQ